MYRKPPGLNVPRNEEGRGVKLKLGVGVYHRNLQVTVRKNLGYK